MTTTKQTERKDNPAHKLWRCQVWANYFYGNMSEAEAVALAGPEPERWLTVEAVQ